MTRSETMALITLGLSMYPATYVTKELVANMVEVWNNELREVTASDATEAFRATARVTPNGFPSLPKVMETLASIRANRRDPEKEFRDAHGGKSREEWQAMLDAENSEEGKKKMAERRRQVEELFARIHARKSA